MRRCGPTAPTPHPAAPRTPSSRAPPPPPRTSCPARSPAWSAAPRLLRPLPGPRAPRGPEGAPATSPPLRPRAPEGLFNCSQNGWRLDQLICKIGVNQLIRGPHAGRGAEAFAMQRGRGPRRVFIWGNGNQAAHKAAPRAWSCPRPPSGGVAGARRFDPRRTRAGVAGGGWGRPGPGAGWLCTFGPRTAPLWPPS